MYDSNKIFTENTFEVNLYAFYCNILYHVSLHKLSLFFYFAFQNLRFLRHQIPKKTPGHRTKLLNPFLKNNPHTGLTTTKFFSLKKGKPYSISVIVRLLF